MAATAAIRPATPGPAGLDALASDAAAEGHPFVARLLAGWRSGARWFDRPGEAFRAGVPVAAGGLNADPYLPGAGTWRLRHVRVRASRLAGERPRRGLHPSSPAVVGGAELPARAPPRGRRCGPDVRGAARVRAGGGTRLHPRLGPAAAVKRAAALADGPASGPARGPDRFRPAARRARGETRRYPSASFTCATGWTSVKFGMSPKSSAPCAAEAFCSASPDSKVRSAITR